MKLCLTPWTGFGRPKSGGKTEGISKTMSKNDDKIITLADLQKDFEAERRRNGQTVIKPKNGDNNYALQDKSYKSSVEYMRKFIKKVREEKT